MLYNIFLGFSQIGGENVIAVDIVSGVMSFFVVALGGVLVGVIFALVISFTTRLGSNSTQLIQS